MNILIAMDSFKGSLTSMQAGDAVKEGILRVDSKADVTVRPLADGGEGTVKALVDGMGGELVSVRVTGPLGEEVCCEYGIVQRCAIIEIAGAAGLTQAGELSKGCGTVHRGRLRHDRRDHQQRAEAAHRSGIGGTGEAGAEHFRP